MTTYPAGTPAWVELSSPDPDASATFYNTLFGWDAVEMGDPEETGGYRSLRLDGKSVGGLSPIMQEGQPPAWTTYVYIDDADETASKIKDNGGQLLMEPFDVLDVGRMAVFTDPTGAACAIWEPKLHTGADIKGEANSLVWNELHTRDTAKANEFYPAVFGWEHEHMDMEGGPGYDMFNVGGDPVAGMIAMDDSYPEGVPPFWLVYFGVEDVDERTAAAKEAGAQEHVEPTDIPGMGRFSALMDPHGASFALWRQASQ